MNNYKIFIDASCDVDPEVIKKEDIGVIPMSYILGEEEKVSYANETPEEIHAFYDALREGVNVSTSQISPMVYVDMFKPALEAGQDILYMCLSSGLTGTYSAVNVVIEDLKEDYPDRTIVAYDTLAATIATGLLVEEAVKNRTAGMGPVENAEALKVKRESLFTMFLVEDLMHLKRGGRISEVTAVLGTALKICPILNIGLDGKLNVIATKRGEMAIKYLQSEFNASCAPDCKRIYVVHADNTERVNKLVELVKESHPDMDVVVSTLCPIIGAHTGPDMTAVICWK